MQQLLETTSSEECLFIDRDKYERNRERKKKIKKKSLRNCPIDADERSPRPRERDRRTSQHLTVLLFELSTTVPFPAADFSQQKQRSITHNDNGGEEWRQFRKMNLIYF
jgi:hypothetical protein